VTSWQKGSSPSAKFAPKLQELEKRVAAGDLAGLAAPKKPGRQPKKARANTKGRGRARPTRTVMRVTSNRAGWSEKQLAAALLDHAEKARDPKPFMAAVRALLSE
jgi:hypothetical protein